MPHRSFCSATASLSLSHGRMGRTAITRGYRVKTAFYRIAAGLLTTTILGGAAQADVKVGVLQSLSGTMAISEVTVKNAEMMAIAEINAAGGVMGQKIVPVVEDGASDPAIFSQKATKLVQSDGVATVDGDWA